MLPAKNRLKKGLFINIYRRGKKEFAKSLVFVHLANNINFPRFGFVVSKKNAKKAVERNKIKRMMREAVKKELQGSIVSAGKDIIITYIDKKSDKSAKEKGFMIHQEIKLLFSRVMLAKK